MKPIFDLDLLQRRMVRQAKRWPAHDFLYRETADALRDRARDIKRDFNDVLEIGWPQAVPICDADLRTDKQITSITRVSPFDTTDGILPVTPGAHDALFTPMVLNWADDPQLLLQQCLFALRPDGVMLGCALGDNSLFELRDVLAQAEQEIYGGISPRVHPMLSVQNVAGLLQTCGFALPVADTERMTVTYATFDALLADLRGLGQTNVLLARRTRPVNRRFWTRAAALYAERYSDARGRLVVTLDVIHWLGWAPHPSQPQPKRRGSATVQLGDALRQ